MADSNVVNGSADDQEVAPLAKKSAGASLLDSREDFEMLEDLEDDVDDDLPPLEDAGGGKKKSSPAKDAATEDKTAERAPAEAEEWLDVLGTLLNTFTSSNL